MFDADSPHVRRLAVSVRGIELRDCGLKPDASPAWHRIFSQHISPRNPRGPSACLLTVSIPVAVYLEPACPHAAPDAKVQMYLVYSKCWTLNLMPLMVYPSVLLHPNFSIKACGCHPHSWELFLSHGC